MLHHSAASAPASALGIGCSVPGMPLIPPPLLPLFTNPTSLQGGHTMALAPTAFLTSWWPEAVAGTPESTPPEEGDSLGLHRAGWSPAQAQPGWLWGPTPAIRSH